MTGERKHAISSLAVQLNLLYDSKTKIRKILYSSRLKEKNLMFKFYYEFQCKFVLLYYARMFNVRVCEINYNCKKPRLLRSNEKTIYYNI